MPSIRTRKKIAKPRIPGFLSPLRRISQNATKDVRGTKFHSDTYEHLPMSTPFVPTASTCIFVTQGIAFYVPPALHRLAKQLVGFGLMALTSLLRNQPSAWKRSVAEGSSIKYEHGPVPCEVQFKPTESDVVVQFSIDTEKVIISLPHPSKWQRSRLEWLALH